MLVIHDGKPWTLSVLGNSSGDMSNVTSSETGTVAAYLRHIDDEIGTIAGTSYTGICDSGMTPSTTTVVCDDLSGKGDDFFNTNWIMVILHNVNSDGNVPEGEIRDITDYVSTTGTFTTAAFSANVEENDVILVARREIFILDGVTLSSNPTTGSLATFVATGGTALGTALADSKSLVDALGHTGSARLDSGLDGLIADGLLNGTGTVLPANKSVYDELGGADSNSYPIAGDTKFINKVALTGEVAYSISDILKVSATEKLKNFIAKTSGTEVPATKSLYDFLLTSDTSGTHDITTANDKTETDVVEITDTSRYGLSMYFDLNALVAAAEGGTVTVRMYNKIDETTYREVGKATFIVGSTTTHPNFEVMRINHNAKFTIQCSTDVTATRTINYRYVKEPME